MLFRSVSQSRYTCLEESKKWKGKLDILLKACTAVLDEEFADTSWEQQFMINEQSPSVVEHRKLSVKRNILNGVAGVEYLL